MTGDIYFMAEPNEAHANETFICFNEKQEVLVGKIRLPGLVRDKSCGFICDAGFRVMENVTHILIKKEEEV